MRESLFSDPEALASLCRRYRIRRLSLFGSTLKGAGGPDSDVDLLVEFEPDARPSLLTMAEIERALSLRAIIWQRRKTQGIARPVPSALHLDFFAAAKPLLLGTARGEVTLLFVTGQMKFLGYLI